MAAANTSKMIWGLAFRILALVAIIIAGVLLVRHFDLGWTGTLLVMLVAGGGGTLVLVRFLARQGELAGALTPALRRYHRRMIASTFVYILALFTATYLYKEWQPTGIAAWFAGALPSLGVAGMLWAMARLLREESDEYIRLKLVQQTLFATGLLLLLATTWGFFEQFGLVPHVPSWAALPVFAIGIGLSSFTKWVRA
jgi:hypothetical protein